jgi:hypothetical protein
LTNNSQSIYLDLPSHAVDDETTIMFTQNMNRIVLNQTPDEKKSGNNVNEHEQTTQQQETTHSVSVFKIIHHTMETLPNNHEVWEHVNPTRAFFTQDKSNTYLKNETLKHFTDWYDYQVYMVAELKGIQYGQEETTVSKLGKILTEESEFLGKSKVRPPPQEGHEVSLDSRESSNASLTPTWGRSKEENHEKRLQKWIDTHTHSTTNKHHTASTPR